MKNYTFEKDETGKITNIFVDGKPVTRASMRGFRKAQTTPYFHLYEDGAWAENPFTGATVRVNGLEATIYAFVKKWERLYSKAVDNGIFPITELTKTPVQTFDDMRMFFRELNSEAYRELLD